MLEDKIQDLSKCLSRFTLGGNVRIKEVEMVDSVDDLKKIIALNSWVYSLPEL